MATIDDQIRRQNPWWSDPGAVDRDPHLARFLSRAVHWDPPVLHAVPLRTGSTHTLRGPRQVGKTTTVKRLVAEVIRTGAAIHAAGDTPARPRTSSSPRVLYFTCDLLTSFQELATVIERAKALHPAPEGPWYLFLDEVSSIADWERGIKYAWDVGLTREDFILVTGSSARDVRKGGELLPGRRGDGGDYLQLPMSFRDFCLLVERLELPEAMAPQQFFETGARERVTATNLQMPALERALRAYMRVGGYPAAVQDFLTTRDHAVTPATLQMLWQVVAGDVGAARRDRDAAAKLFEEVGVCLGNPFNWSHASKAMGLRDEGVAKEYVELLAETFTLLPIYFWDVTGGFMPQKQRKVFFLDPLLAAIPRAIIPGARAPEDDGLFENLTAVALFRAGTTMLLQASAVAGAIGYWRSSNEREIDFVVPTPAGPRIPVEVKGDSDGRIGHARIAIRKSFRRGIIATPSAFEWSDDVLVMPNAVLLALLCDRVKRDASIA